MWLTGAWILGISGVSMLGASSSVHSNTHCSQQLVPKELFTWGGGAFPHLAHPGRNINQQHNHEGDKKQHDYA